MLAASDLSLALSGRLVVRAVTAAIRPGALTVLVGPNGAGKTTFLRALAGALAPAGGSVTLDGRPLASFTRTELARRRAVLSQSGQISFPFTVAEVVALGLTAAGRTGRGERERAVREALSAVDLAGFGGRLFQELSGGEQQRVQIARVLCQIAAGTASESDAPADRWLLLDEPTSSLDVGHQLHILDLAQAHAEAGGGAVAVLHDLNLAALYADRILMFSRGSLVADGAPDEVFTDARIGEVFCSRLRVVEARGRRLLVPEMSPAALRAAAE
ncbi:heme ABC transporter ATP-binding protein [Propylenella binzhouense]|uniref:Heme ABC transporter ATP-binding protein n=1 Tax=Propylenella binzhouense TaxID=2555902 RepID=A0A964T6K1_9HYPH|nr:heme ABC transporter ATP-binding protein [Propylenella binzhouense]MYZ49423.1 heme ABC transporter ATP-binding protein [Propylenella binzhouense]